MKGYAIEKFIIIYATSVWFRMFPFISPITEKFKLPAW